MRCDYDYFCELQDAANGLIKLVDIAPEEPGAIEFIDKVRGSVVVSIAHTAADYDTAVEAIEHGASHATHCIMRCHRFITGIPELSGL